MGWFFELGYRGFIRSFGRRYSTQLWRFASGEVLLYLAGAKQEKHPKEALDLLGKTESCTP